MKKVSIYELNFSARAINILKSFNITTLQELSTMSEEDFLTSKNCGQKTLLEIKEVLQLHGLSFRMKKEFLETFYPTIHQELEKSGFEQDFFDQFTIDLSGASIRLRNVLNSQKISNIFLTL